MTQFSKILIGLIVVLCFSLGTQAQVKTINNTPDKSYTVLQEMDIAMKKPPGFTNSDCFSGFQYKPNGTSIMADKVPVVYQEAALNFTKELFEQQGFKMLDRKELKINGKDAVFCKIRQTQEGEYYHKYMLAYPFGQETLIVSGVFAEYLDDQMSQVVEKSILSVVRTD